MRKLSLLVLPALLLGCGAPQPQPEFTSFTDQIRAANTESRQLAESVSSTLTPGFTSQSLSALDIPSSSKKALLKLRQDVIARFPNIINQSVWLVESGQLVVQSNKKNVTSDMIGMYVIGTSDPAQRFRQVWVATITANLRTKEVLNTAIAPDLKTEYVAASDRYQDASGAWPLFRFLVVGDPAKSSQSEVPQMSLGQLPTPVHYVDTAGFNTDGSERAPHNP